MHIQNPSYMMKVLDIRTFPHSLTTIHGVWNTVIVILSNVVGEGILVSQISQGLYKCDDVWGVLLTLHVE